MSNKLYDIIVAKHIEYENYNSFLEKKKLEFRDKRQALIEDLMTHNLDKEEVEVTNEQTEKLFDLQTEEKLYIQDVQMLFYTLYILVEAYVQLPDTIVLPKDITELCTSLSYTIPKSIFIVDDKGFAHEREKGKLKEIQNPFYKDSQIKVFTKSVQDQIKQALKTKESTPE